MARSPSDEDRSPDAHSSPDLRGISSERLHGEVEQRRGRLGESLEKARFSLEAKRGSSRIVDTMFFGLESNARIPLAVLAGALASRIVVFVIPLLVLLVMVTGTYASVFDADPSEVARALGMAGLLLDATSDAADMSDGLRVGTIAFTVFAVVWSASALGKLIRRTHALIWDVGLQRPSKRWSIPVGVIGASLVGAALAGSRSQVQGWPATWAAAELVGEMVALTILWVVLSRFLPHAEDADSWLHLLPGAALVGLSYIALKVAIVVYLAPKSVTLGARYGDLASAILLLTWAYWIAFIIVFATGLNSAVFRSRSVRARS